ncbi:MAG: IS3 family transposase [Bilifractor sp.]
MRNYEEAYHYVFEYINTFYNTIRVHSHCGYLSPDQYKRKYLD